MGAPVHPRASVPVAPALWRAEPRGCNAQGVPTDLSITPAFTPGGVAGYGPGRRGKEPVLTQAVPSSWKTLTRSRARAAAQALAAENPALRAQAGNFPRKRLFPGNGGCAWPDPDPWPLLSGWNFSPAGKGALLGAGCPGGCARLGRWRR